jgi:ATP-dependent Zn protease
MVAALRRRIRDEARTLKFTDIVHFVLHGTAEFDVNDTHDQGLYRCAVHEAGHAVVAMVDSGGADIPDYAAIGTSHDFAGVTTHSYSHRIEEDFDQSSVLHQIRNSLGGRAAEEIVFGPMGMSARGAGGDLANVTSLLMEMYLECGMFSDPEDPATSTDHLIVAPEDPTPAQLDRAAQAARDYVTTQYRIVLQQLRENRALLDAVTHELNNRQLLDCDDFAALWQAHQQKQGPGG